MRTKREPWYQRFTLCDENDSLRPAIGEDDPVRSETVLAIQSSSVYNLSFALSNYLVAKDPPS